MASNYRSRSVNNMAQPLFTPPGSRHRIPESSNTRRDPSVPTNPGTPTTPASTSSSMQTTPRTPLSPLGQLLGNRLNYSGNDERVTLTAGDLACLEELLERKLASTNESSRRIKVPKPVKEAVHAVVKALGRMEPPVTFDFSQGYRDIVNLDMKEKIITAVKNKIGNVDQQALSKSIRSYYLTLQANHKRVVNNTKDRTLKRQRKQQRLTNSRRRRKATLAKTPMTAEEKARVAALLVDNSYISSEDSEEVDDSGDENEVKGKIFVTRPLEWRSDFANRQFTALDKRARKIAAKLRGGAPYCDRKVGERSSRMPPDDAPEWALQVGPLNSEDEETSF